MRRTKLSLCVIVTLAACGRDAEVDAAAYRSLANELAAEVEVHRATSQSMAPGDCPAEAARYAGEARPRLDAMTWMSAEMDACMGATHGETRVATCASMRDEIEAHLSGACVAPDLAGEATRHASAMQAMIDHELRATSTMGGSMMGPRGDCLR